MSYKTILYDVTAGIALITLNRPDALNSLNSMVLLEVTSAVQTAGVDNDVNVIILTGAGRAFCAGVDLKSLGNSKDTDVIPKLNNAARDLQIAIETVPKVVIAAVNGFCLTGGLEIALTCDLIVVANEARIGDTHTKWGLRCTWGMSQRLPYRVGELKAHEMTYTADMISGVEAEKIGLVNRSVPLDQLETTVRELAGKIAANSRDAVAAHKLLYTQSRQETISQGLKREYSTLPRIKDTAHLLGEFVK
ncbi:enoyl-CoA hydratase/isomerase family protein [bacterium]|nr:enoyl-CoA hydratase/isomerase family protein [bacterium]